MVVLVIGFAFVFAWFIVLMRYWYEPEGISLTKDILYNTALFVTLTIGGTCIVYWVMCNTMLAFMLFG